MVFPAQKQLAEYPGVWLGGILRQVPRNFAWVVRDALGSFPGTLGTTQAPPQPPHGYFVKREGYRIYIPYLQIDEGLVNLAPLVRPGVDIKAPTGEREVGIQIIVNTSDNQNAAVFYRIETVVIDPILFVIRVGPNRENIEDGNAYTAISQRAATETMDDLTQFGEQELLQMGHEVTRRFNDLVANTYGIEAQRLSILKITPPKVVMDEAEHRTAVSFRQQAAQAEAAAMDHVIRTVGANPTTGLTMLTARDIARDLKDGFVALVESLAHLRAESKGQERKEEKK